MKNWLDNPRAQALIQAQSI